MTVIDLAIHRAQKVKPEHLVLSSEDTLRVVERILNEVEEFAPEQREVYNRILNSILGNFYFLLDTAYSNQGTESLVALAEMFSHFAVQLSNDTFDFKNIACSPEV